LVLADTHCHLDFEKFDVDRAGVLQRAWDAGLTRILIPGINLSSNRAVVELAESHPNLFAAVGVHPGDSLTWDGTALSAMRELAASSKVVAVGEIGLDYYWDAAPHDHQGQILREQLALAAEMGLPVIIHMREKGDTLDGPCAEDLMNLLEEWTAGLRNDGSSLMDRPGVLHSFSGSRSTAESAIRLGFCIGVTGPVTFKNAGERQGITASLPIERILLETDAPFLAPHPHRGQRNEPAYIPYIADKIAQLQHRSPEEVAAITSANAQRLFSWGGQD
jgi:TatD DNase family protein